MPSRVTPSSDPSQLPEEAPTGKATLQIEARADRGRRVSFRATVPGRDTAACAKIAAGAVIGAGGPPLTIQAAGLTPVWTACVAFAQVVAGAVIVWRAGRDQRR